jgi:hypothetical protein
VSEEIAQQMGRLRIAPIDEVGRIERDESDFGGYAGRARNHSAREKKEAGRSGSDASNNGLQLHNPSPRGKLAHPRATPREVAPLSVKAGILIPRVIVLLLRSHSG